MNTQPFKILCIDGGGIKGLFSAAILAQLELKTGKKAGDCFDMICGTSTGGLIALALASGKPASDLVGLYYNHGGEIFPTSNNRLVRFIQRKILQFAKQVAFYGKFSNKALKKRLEAAFGTRTLGELDNLVCIPSYNLVAGMPRVFKFPHKEGGFFKDRDIHVVDAALATSAAPTYLPIHEHEHALYVDGGLWANNPSLCGLTEALQYFVGEDKAYQTVEMLSIPSLSHPSGWASGGRKSRSFIGWTSKLIQVPMEGQAYFTDFFLKKVIHRILKDAKYVRLEQPLLSAEHMKVIDMDRTDAKALKTLKTLGEQVGNTKACDPDVLAFFETPKTYFTR